MKPARKPRLEAHKTLWGLAQRLVKIENLTQADEWISQLQEFHNIYGKWLGEKTYRSEILPDDVPSWVRPNQEWWCYLHSENPVTPHLLIRPKHLKPQAKPQTREPKPGPALWDTGIDLTQTNYHPDISIRKGTIR